MEIIMELIFEMRFKTHGVKVSKLKNGEIRCFKYTNSRFDYVIFHNELDAIDYMIEPFPSLQWKVEINEED